MNKKRKILAAAVFSAGIVLLAGCGSTEPPEEEKGNLDFQQFASVEFEGFNGDGTVVITKNTDLYDDEDVLEEIYPGKSAKKAEEKLNDFMETVTFKPSEVSGLSNGDEVTVTVTYDKDVLGKKIKVEKEEFVITVEGLEESVRVDPFEGLSVEFSGNDGKGKVEVNTSGCGSFVKDYVEFSIDKTEDFSNGDKITVKAECNEADLKRENVVLSKETMTYTVSDLKESVEIDPFENLEITYTGASPYITPAFNTVKCSELVQDYIDFRFEDDLKYVRNGDTFTVYAVYNDYDAENERFSVTADEKTYTVEDQPEMLTSLDGLYLAEINKELDDKLAAVTAASVGDIGFAGTGNGYFDSINAKNYQTSYLVSLKSQFEDKYDKRNYNYNRYIQIYEYEITYHQALEKNLKTKVYVAVYANNICKNENGTISWDLNLGSKAYEDRDKLINEFVTSNKEYYNVTEIKPQAPEAEKTE